MIKNCGRAFLVMLLVGCAGHGRSSAPESLQGTIEYQDRVLAFEVPGRVRSVDVQRGDQVVAGRLLAALDDTMALLGVESRQSEAEAARAQTALVRAGTRPEEIQAAQAQLAAARAVEEQMARNLARDEGLSRAGAKPPALVDDLRAQVRQATEERLALEHRLKALRSGARRPEIEGAVERARALATAAQLEKSRFDRYRLTASAPGTVLDVHVEPGEVVAAGTPVVTLADTHHPFVEVFVAEGQLTRVAVGASAWVRVDGVPAPLPGHVEHIARQAEFTPRYLFSERERPNLVFRVRLRIDNPGEQLRAGLPAFATMAGVEVR